MLNFPTPEKLAWLRKKYPPGTRIELKAPLEDPYATQKAGDRATIRGIDGAGNMLCAWDCGSSLNLLPDLDSFEVIGAFTDEMKRNALAIRASGKANMLAVKDVQYIANQMGFYALVLLLEDDPAAYVHWILRGE
jgi:hypothetical protein